MLTGENVAWILLAGAFEWRSICLMLTAACSGIRKRTTPTDFRSSLLDPDGNRNIIEQGSYGWCGAPSMRYGFICPAKLRDVERVITPVNEKPPGLGRFGWGKESKTK
jgi:hypothetical protein